ncbi:hypothetical protein COV13_00955 [Candidatus Woesearchaeota archaeon CG10_big_fil_rev_8_21_14_0_10_32_9]|nr:MAG: hypothetical protein COV13_00955 [Candidatus Woesearchaeota archaeon CG10_big_fil_rev_8_21_14_0_10_32_9]
MSEKHELLDGTKRVKTKDLKQYSKKGLNWIVTSDMTDSTRKAIELYTQNKKIEHLVDSFVTDFLKGHITPENQIGGGRIKILPNGKKLARGGFSIFAKNLKFNNNNLTEWDVSYDNVSGLKTYLYNEDKLHLEQNRKAKLVDKFSAKYTTILNELEQDIKRFKTIEYLALYALLITKIRVGHLEYYKHLGHKGLTTLQKKDITIKRNAINFKFIGKDGIPQNVTKDFPEYYIKLFKNILLKKKNNDFVFANSNGFPLHSDVFSKILYKYTGEHFYPHIIRSHYADTESKNFLNKHKKSSKQEVLDEFKLIAAELGHKKFNKKKNDWELDYKVTVANYIRPKFSEKMKELYETK